MYFWSSIYHPSGYELTAMNGKEIYMDIRKFKDFKWNVIRLLYEIIFYVKILYPENFSFSKYLILLFF